MGGPPFGGGGAGVFHKILGATRTIKGKKEKKKKNDKMYHLEFADLNNFFECFTGMSSKPKRGTVTGFDGVRGSNTTKRIHLWDKNQPSGRWRRVELVKVRYTYIKQTWTHQDKTFTKTHIWPYGMN